MVTHPVSAVSRDLLNLHELRHLALPNPPLTHTISTMVSTQIEERDGRGGEVCVCQHSGAGQGQVALSSLRLELSFSFSIFSLSFLLSRVFSVFLLNISLGIYIIYNIWSLNGCWLTGYPVSKNFKIKNSFDKKNYVNI